MKTTRTTKRCSNSRRRRGATIVEGAVVLTSLVIILFGMLDLSLLVLEFNTLAEAARRLCRQAAVHGQMAPPLMTAWGPTSVTGIASDGTEYAQALKPELVTFDLTQVNFTIDWPDGANQSNNRVRVTVNYRYQPMMPFVLSSSVPITIVTTMQVSH